MYIKIYIIEYKHIYSICRNKYIAAVATQLFKLKFRNLIYLYIFYYLLIVNLYKYYVCSIA